MSWFCTHKWKVLKTTFAAPPMAGKYFSPKDLLLLTNGVTTVILCCEKCGKLVKEEMLGT